MTQNRTPTFTETVQRIIDSKLMEIHTSLPAKIVSYNQFTNLAVVQPLLKRKYKEETTAILLPTISNVPVAFPRLGNAWVRFPVLPNYEGQLFFCERSIDKWLTTGGATDPDDPRRFDLSDAVFHLGLTSQTNPMVSLADNSSLEIHYGDSWIEIKESGKFKITDGTNELFEILVQLMQDLKTATDSLGIPFNADSIAKFELLRVKLDLMKG